MPFFQHSFGTQHLDGAVDRLDFLNAAFFGNRASGRIRNSGVPVAVHCNATIHSEIARGESHAENLIVHLKKASGVPSSRLHRSFLPSFLMLDAFVTVPSFGDW